MLVGHYILLGGLLRSLGVPLESEQVADDFSSIAATVAGQQREPNTAQ